MRWRIVGVTLLLISIVLAGLILIPIPASKSNTLLEWDKSVNGTIPLPYVYYDMDIAGPLFAAKNVTINPLGHPNNTNYVVNVLVNVFDYNVTPVEPAVVDLWIVNHTGALLIGSYLNNGTYPVNVTQPFEIPGVTAYCESIFKSLIVKPLQGLDYNGNYTVILINPYDGVTANVTIVIEDALTWTEYLMQPNVVNILLTAIIALTGGYLALKKPKKADRVKRRKK